MGNRCRIPSRNFGAALAPLPATRHAESFQHRPDAVSRKGFDPTGKIPPRFAGQVGDVFRVETATHQIDDLRAYRPKEGGPADDLKWRPLRYGVADLHRRTEISQRFNERYLNALSGIDDSTQQTSACVPASLLRRRPCPASRRSIAASSSSTAFATEACSPCFTIPGRYPRWKKPP